MFPTAGAQLPATDIVLDDQAGSDEERLSYLAHGSGWQAQGRSNDVQPSRPVGDNAEVTLFRGPKSENVCLLQQARSFKVVERNCHFAFGPANSSTGLQEP